MGEAGRPLVTAQQMELSNQKTQLVSRADWRWLSFDSKSNPFVWADMGAWVFVSRKAGPDRAGARRRRSGSRRKRNRK